MGFVGFGVSRSKNLSLLLSKAASQMAPYIDECALKAGRSIAFRIFFEALNPRHSVTVQQYSLLLHSEHSFCQKNIPIHSIQSMGETFFLTSSRNKA
jgi:hypothetical protein